MLAEIRVAEVYAMDRIYSKGYLIAELVRGVYVIGRSSGSDILLANDNEVSRRHAQLERDHRGEWRICDLGSTNGTYVNDELVTKICELYNGDRIRVGDTVLTLELAPSSTTVTAAPVVSYKPTSTPAPPLGSSCLPIEPPVYPDSKYIEAPPVEPASLPLLCEDNSFADEYRKVSPPNLRSEPVQTAYIKPQRKEPYSVPRIVNDAVPPAYEPHIASEEPKVYEATAQKPKNKDKIGMPAMPDLSGAKKKVSSGVASASQKLPSNMEQRDDVLQTIFEKSLWFACNRILAFLLAHLTGGVTWTLAGIGCSRQAQQGGHNLMAMWAASSHQGRLRTAAIVDAVFWGFIVLTFLGNLFSGGLSLILVIPWILLLFCTTCDIVGALGTGRDSFAIATSFAGTTYIPCHGRIAGALQKQLVNYPPFLQVAGVLIWCWAVAVAMMLAVWTMIILFVAIWLLSLVMYIVFSAIDAGADSSSSRYYEHVPRCDNRERHIREGQGGSFAKVVATIEGDEIKAGMGGPFAKVVATIEGDEIKTGMGGPFAKVLATIEGDEIKTGMGGPFAKVLATIEGNQIREGHGGIFSQVVYTIDS
jgi:hypothetical protein